MCVCSYRRFTVISRLSTQLDPEMVLRTYAGDAYLTVFVSHCAKVRTKLDGYVINKNYSKVLEVEDQLLYPRTSRQSWALGTLKVTTILVPILC